MKTVAHCSHGRLAGVDQKASSIAATPTVYPMTTWHTKQFKQTVTAVITLVGLRRQCCIDARQHE